ncbi:MAG: trigger factor [Gemmatimonadetes bacterium]|nr:trigger factor [Gemmatimonadota bacterium]
MAVESSNLTIEVERPAAWARRLTITVPAAQVARARAQTMTRLSQRLRLPGFRKGKVPAAVLEKRFGQAVDSETVEKLVGDAYRAAVEREGLRPISQASVENIDYAAGRDLTFRVDLEVMPEIELQRLGGFSIRRETPQVTDDQVGRVLERLREQNAVLHPIEEGHPAAGDVVRVSITRLDTDPPGEPRRYEIVLGEDQALPAIEDAIRTMKPGQEGDFAVDLPRNAQDPVSPVERHDLRIGLLEVRRPERPPLDDELARAVGPFESLDLLRERIRADLEREAGREAERGVRSRLLQLILEANSFEVPDAMVREYLEKLVPEAEVADTGKLVEIRDSARPAAIAVIHRHLVIDRVAELESLQATPAEVDARLEAVAQALGRPVGQVRAQFQKNGRLQEIESEITEDKVFEYLKQLSTID